MADARQISVRLAIEGAEQARAQLEAVREAAKKTGEEGAPTAAQLRQWDSLQRSVDSNHAAAARYADTVRRVQAAEAAGLGTAEQRNRVLEQAALAHQRATSAMEAHVTSTRATMEAGATGARSYGVALGQAGFQIQDFATQVAMGQNALTAFGVQFAQFAGIFGTGGAIAGAVVTVGLLGAQFLGGADAAKALNDAIEAQERLYGSATDAADRYIAGLDREAETLTRLRGLYASYSETRRRAEEFRLLDSQATLETQDRALRSRVGNVLPSGFGNLIDMTSARAARGQGLPGEIGEIPAQVREGIAAVLELRAGAATTAEALASVSVRLQDAAALTSGPLADGFRSSAEAVRALMPEAERLERSAAENARQLAAVRDAAGGTTTALTGTTTALTGTAGAVGAVADGLQRLRNIILTNPLATLETDLANIEARRAALAERGVEGLRAEEQAQRDAAQVAADANRVYEQQIRALRESGIAQEQAEQQARAAQAAARQLAMARNQAAAALREESQQAEESARIAERQAQRVQAAVQRVEEERRRASEQEAQRQARAFDQAEELARRTAQQAIAAGRREQDRSQAQAEREAERQAEREQRRQDDVAREWSRGLADATFAGLQAGFGRGEGIAQAFARVLGNVVQRSLSNVLAEQIFMPIVSGFIGGGGGIASAASGGGGLSSLLSGGGMLGNAGSMLSSGAEYLGFGGFTGGGIMSSLNGYAAAAFPGMFSAYSPAFLAQPGNMAALEAAGVGSIGAPGAAGLGTFGGALAGIGGGFMIGSTVGGMLAGRSAARAQNAQIGAGLGAVGGFLIGGPIGGLIGGSLGGAAGGLIGPGPKTNAFGFSLDASGGKFGTSGLQTTGNGNGGPEVMAQAQAYAEQVNAFLEANKIIVAAGNRVINGQTNSEDQSKTFNDAFKFFRFNADAGGTLGRVLKDRPFDSPEALTKAVDFAAVYDVLSGIKKPTDQWAQQIEALNKTFEEATKKAKDFGLATDVLATGQAKATAIINAQREASILGGLLGQSRVLTGFLDSRFGAGGSPQTQFAAAQEQYEAALSAARKATAETADLQRYTAAANNLLNASSSFFGSGAQAAAIESMVRTQTIALGQALDLPAFTTDVTGAIERAASRQIDQLQQLNATVALLRDEARAQRLVIERLRAA
jgi:hypothetical protein